jgi:hypothetical protein
MSQCAALVPLACSRCRNRKGAAAALARCRPLAGEVNRAQVLGEERRPVFAHVDFERRQSYEQLKPVRCTRLAICGSIWASHARPWGVFRIASKRPAALCDQSFGVAAAGTGIEFLPRFIRRLRRGQADWRLAGLRPAPISGTACPRKNCTAHITSSKSTWKPRPAAIGK